MPLIDTYHAYVFGTAFWYWLRGTMRIINPWAVTDWFRPPVDSLLKPNDLELYTVWTDGWGLYAMAALLLVLADAVPLPESLVGSSFTVPASERAKKPYARAMIIITIFHHIMTGIGAYTHWVKPTHHTIAMDIGVYGNIGLTILGILALRYGLDEGKLKASPRKVR